MSAFFLQKICIFYKNSTSKQSYWSFVREFLVLFSVFVRLKVTINKNLSLIDYASRIGIPDCSKLATNQKNDNCVIICWLDVIVKFFWRCHVSFVTFSYWSKFHINIMTGSGVKTVFVYKGLNWSPKIENTRVLPNKETGKS